MAYYESEEALGQYLLFHYGTPEQIFPYSFGPRDSFDFPVRCVSDCVVIDRLKSTARGLDLGCAVGRSSLELARYCNEVIGIDFSTRFIDAAKTLQQGNAIEFELPVSGHLKKGVKVAAPKGVDLNRVQFQQGDAHHLPSDIGTFDVILMNNLIDRLSDPIACLKQIPSRINSGGQLIITSPYTWLPEYTPIENWIGAKFFDGNEKKTLQHLQELLSPDFELAIRKDIPFLIREHSRKFQWSVSEATVWIKK